MHKFINFKIEISLDHKFRKCFWIFTQVELEVEPIESWTKRQTSEGQEFL